MTHDIVRRYPGNPILTKTGIPYPVGTVHNAAIVKHRDEYIYCFDPTCAQDGRLSVWLQPEDLWEVIGYVHNVVFSCGAVPESDGTVKI